MTKHFTIEKGGWKI